jgi:PAS domain S-box-containing protein
MPIKGPNERISQELFLLLSDITLIENPDRLLFVFANALMNILQDDKIEFCQGKPHKDARYVFDISTPSKTFGFIVLSNDGHGKDEETANTIKRAMALLALMLERFDLNAKLEKQLTVNKQLEGEKNELIQENHKIYKHILENSPDIVFRFDPELKCIYANSKTHLFVQAPGAILKGLHLSNINLPFKFKTDLETGLKKALQLQKIVITIIESDWNKKSFEFRLIPEHYENGDIAGVIGLGRDITEKLKTEKELVLAKEKAEESDRLKLAFLANISHEIRTPLNGIIGFSRLLVANKANEQKSKEYIRIIESSTNTLLRTMSNILEISKIESGDFNTLKNPFDFQSFLQKIFDEYSHQLKKTNKESLGFSFSFPNQVIKEVNADQYRLEEIIINLLDNAFKFTLKGGVELGYFVKGKNIICFVRDTGIGIKKKELALIFNRFYQVDYSVNKEYGGLGLGLTISKALVEKMGGKIWIDSIYKKGTTIFFNIPYKGVLKRNKKEEQTQWTYPN